MTRARKPQRKNVLLGSDYFVKFGKCQCMVCCENGSQCDQIGRFLKVFGNKISSKRSPNDWQIFGLFWKTSYEKMHWLLFAHLLEKIGLLFTPTSGHTGRRRSCYKNLPRRRTHFNKRCPWLVPCRWCYPGAANRPRTVWPEKNRQMSIKFFQKWFH